jgi:hypothetical protein
MGSTEDRMTLLIAKAEGSRRCYEVLESIDGYVVRATDLETGSVIEEDLKLFRTAPAAFAFAELVAVRDRFAAQCAADEDVADELDACARRFEDLARSLGDDGVGSRLLCAWSAAEAAASRRHYH